MEKIVAVIGRPNVGKSTLFNRILGRRVAIVHAVSGVTRDRNYGEAEWTGKRFFLIDTGGFVPDSEEEFNKQIRAQVKIAIDEADKILFLVDGLGGIHPIDVEIAQILRRHSKGKEIILAANKVDNTKRDLNISDFYSLGLGEPLGISALSGRNVAELLDESQKIFHWAKKRKIPGLNLQLLADRTQENLL
jgi:GTP-binding protein